MDTIIVIISVAAVLLWLYVLIVCKKANLKFAGFAIGSVGFFAICCLFLRGVTIPPLTTIMTRAAGMVGEATGFYMVSDVAPNVYFSSGNTYINLQLDIECLGFIEITTMLAMIWFYKLYDPWEKFWRSLVSTVVILVLNVLRISVICVMTAYWGFTGLQLGHLVVGRGMFIIVMLFLFFYMFTAPQIKRQKVGKV